MKNDYVDSQQDLDESIVVTERFFCDNAAD
jgi:hypothetical protein